MPLAALLAALHYKAMRRLLPLLLLTAAGPGFQPGQWQSAPIGGVGEARAACITRMDNLLTGARSRGECGITPISKDAAQTVITWRCADGSSGRTQLRRDAAGVYTVHIQGVDGGLPFMEHAEWRHTGRC